MWYKQHNRKGWCVYGKSENLGLEWGNEGVVLGMKFSRTDSYFSCKAMLIVFSRDSHLKLRWKRGQNWDEGSRQGVQSVIQKCKGTQADFLSYLCVGLWRASVEIVWRAGCVGRQCWSGRCDCNNTELRHGQSCKLDWAGLHHPLSSRVWGTAGVAQVCCYVPCRSYLHYVLLGIQYEKNVFSSQLKNRNVF